MKTNWKATLSTTDNGLQPNRQQAPAPSRLKGVASLVAIGLLAWTSTMNAAGPVTLQTLLREMTDREQLTRLRDSPYTTRSFSSYDRASVAPDKPGWFANGDSSQFIREEQNGDRSERVMLDADGPGAIVRFWVTIAGAKEQGILRIYLDHATTPIIEGKVLEILSGGKLCGEPLSTSVSPLTGYMQRGHNLYLPIPYARHCKISYESAAKGESFYYNVEARTYGKEVAVETLTADGLRQNANAIAETNRKLAGTDAAGIQPAIAGLKHQTLEGTIAPGEALTRTFEGPGAIHRLALSLGSGSNFNQALRSTILEISFDGEHTVWVPLGEFFGTGYQLSPHKTWFVSVAADGTMQADWVMPFQKTCTVSVRNLGTAPVTLTKGALAVAPYRWDASSMHFGAGWYELRRYAVTAPKDANYVTLTGRGVLVGTGVTVFNTVDSWWGEGDEKVYVDGEAFPSFFGTGSEDYYGYAWCNGNRFDHPFLAQPDGTGDTHQGVVVNTRYRMLDAIPFSKGLRFDMEICHHSHCALINYAPATFWYMKPGGNATLGKNPQRPGDEKIQAMAREKIVTRRNDLMAPEPFVRGRLEAELMAGSATGGRITYPRGWGSSWSGGEAINWIDGKPGDTAQLTFQMKEASPANIVLGMAFHPGGGKVQISLNGQALINEANTYAERDMQVQANFTTNLRQGENTLTVKLLGKDDKARNQGFLFDYIDIHPQPK